MQETGMFEALSDPRMRHAAIVHLPVAVATLAPILAIASALLKGQNTTLRVSTVAAYALLLITAFLATQSGSAAESRIGNAARIAREQVHEHEEMGEKVWLFALACCALAGCVWLKNPQARVGAAWGTALVGLITASWVGITAHHGGTAVYAFGVGTPKPVTDHDLLPPGDERDPFGDPRAAFFRRQIEPLLTDVCMGCHGPDGPDGVNLTGIAAILRGGEHGPTIRPGDADGSPLYRVLRYDGDVKMPPDGKLPDEQIEAIRRWIAEGAVWTPREG